MSWETRCPKCGYIQWCPCKNCKDKFTPKDVKPWIWVSGELIKCAECGLIASGDWWQDVSWFIFKRKDIEHKEIS